MQESMNPETLRKEFEKDFGSVFKGVHLDHGEHYGFHILTELEESLFSWFLSKLSQAQAEAREEGFTAQSIKFFEEQKEVALARGDLFWINEFDLQIKYFRSKFPPQTN